MLVLPVEVDTDELPLKEKSISIIITLWQFDVFLGVFQLSLC